MSLFIVLWWKKYEKAPWETHIHKTKKSKPTSNKLKENVCFTLKMHYFCNNLIWFQFLNHGHEFFSYATWFLERPNRKLCIYADIKLFVVSWWQNCEKAATNQPAISWKKDCFVLKTYFFAIVWSEQKKIDKVFLANQQTNLVKT